MYKVGDKVMVISSKEIENKWTKSHSYWNNAGSSVVFNYDMFPYCSKMVTIKSSKQRSDDEPYYRIVEDSGSWMWTKQMLKGCDCNDKVFDVLRGQ